MELSKLNLNLLRALHALLSSRHVTVAGKQIGLSQSAMSISLKQLRELFNDDLLVRGLGRSMQLTPLGKSLVAPVAEAMKLIDDIFVGRKPFIPESDTRTFHVGMTDMPSFILMPRLIKRLRVDAPNIKIIVHHPKYFQTTEIFESGELDLIIGVFENAPDTLKVQTLFVDEGVIVARKDHPGVKDGEIEMAEFLKYPLIQMTHPGAPYGNYIDKNLIRMGYDARVSVSVPHGLIPMISLPGTDYMTLTIRHMAEALTDQLDLAMLEPPFEVGPYVCRQYWHQQDNNDPAHQWLRRLFKEIADSI
jgi:DNA-binding transcriptional LysR family regulator